MKIVLAILLLMMSFSFIAENIILQKYAIAQELNADKDAKKSAEKEGENKKAEELKEKYHSTASYQNLASRLLEQLPFSRSFSLLPSGYINKPYTPPDLA